MFLRRTRTTGKCRLMPESRLHSRLIMAIRLWVEHTYVHRTDIFLYVDETLSVSRQKPPRLNGFVPDVYATSLANDLTIVGEAKTGLDLETRRSREQLFAFLRHLSCSPCPLLALAIEWQYRATAKSLLQLLKRRAQAEPVTVIILDNAPVGVLGPTATGLPQLYEPID